MMGIILSSVTEIERPAASSISILLEMLFGMFPAPYIYSLVYESTQKLDGDGVNISRGGMYTLFFSVFVGLIGLAVALPLRKKSLQASEIRTKKVIEEKNPNAGEEEIALIMGGGDNNEEPLKAQVNDVSNI